MIAFWVWLTLAGCERATPEQQAMSAALHAWQEGSDRLEKGDLDGAREAFARGLAVRPDDPLLGAWDARAAAESGDLDGAIRRLRQVVRLAPGFAEARYNLAAYLARNGALDEAGAELEVAVNNGARPAREVLSDPDFSPHLAHPAFAFLPSTDMVVAVSGPDGPVFWGSLGTLTLRVSGIDDNAVHVATPPVTGPIELVGVVEDHMRSTDGKAVDLSWTFKAVGAGSIALGPFEIAAGSFKASARAVTIQTTAPEGKEVPQTAPSAFRFLTPTELGGAYEDGSAHRIDGGVAVKALITDRIDVEPSATSMVQYDSKMGGQSRWMLRHYRGFQSPPERVKISRGGEVLFDGPPLDNP